MPRIAEISAIPWATRSRGNSSRMIPNASGKIAPPAPWMTRPMMSRPMLLASAATSDPNASVDERDDEHPLLAEHVAEPPEDRREDRGAEQEGGEHPRDGGGGGVQVALDLGQRRRHEGLQQGVGRAAEREDAEREAVVLAVGSVAGNVNS